MNVIQEAPQASRAVCAPGGSIRVAAVVAALSRALDLSTGQIPGHSIRACVLGMRIGKELGLSDARLNELYYALLLKDCGCSGNSSMTYHALGANELIAKRDVKVTDWTRASWETLHYALTHIAVGKPFLERVRLLYLAAVNQKTHARDVTKIRCERGATLCRSMGLPEGSALAIHDLDEHWDGSGNPEGLRGPVINYYSRIMLLAQTLDNFAVVHSRREAVEVMERRSGKWFDPDIVKATLSLAKGDSLWTDMHSPDLVEEVLALDRREAKLEMGDSAMDSICVAFAHIVDAKSPFTYNHSNGVANASVAIAQRLGLPRDRIMFVRHAALLHDLGKLGVSNEILEKPGKLTDDEWKIVKRHPEDTWRILKTIPSFEELSEVSAAHHEKLNGKGYFRSFAADQMSTEARIIAVADIFDALSGKRPYRDSLPLETVFSIMRKDAPEAIDADCLRALEESGIRSDQSYTDLQQLQMNLQLYQ